jgi:hypothetical protein
MEDPIVKEDLPTSFGSFKPVGHVMLGLPSKLAAHATVVALQREGISDAHITEFTPRETVEDMQAMIDNASVLSGFGSEIGMMRRYLDLAKAGYAWLLVKADATDDAQAIADTAKLQGAALAVYYRALIVEELI